MRCFTSRASRRCLDAVSVCRWAAASLCCALASGLSAADVPPRGLAEQRRLLAEGETRLQAGDVDAARRALEQAALASHAADVELAQLRTMMQAGEYRKALAFAAHVAGAHLDAAEGAVLYAWLLKLGGQHGVAKQVLDTATRRLPNDPMLGRVPGWWGVPDSAAMTAAPAWLAPYSVGGAVPADAQVAGSALLLPGGRHAIAALADADNDRRVWLRNGLGRTSAAEPVRRDPATSLVLLRLVDPLEAPLAWSRAAREAFAGSAAYVVGFAPDASARAAWPQLSIGVLGAGVAGSDARWLGTDVPRGTVGAPVIDQAGRVVGISVRPGSDGRSRMAGIGALEALAGPLPLADSGSLPRLGLDEIYEQAMRTALQVLIVR